MDVGVVRVCGHAISERCQYELLIRSVRVQVSARKNLICIIISNNYYFRLIYVQREYVYPPKYQG